MNIFKSFIELLQTPVTDRPESFGVYHLVCLAITILITVLICIFYKNASDKKFRRITFIFWIIMVICEIGKQLIYSFVINGDAVTYSYSMIVLPYQFCSTPFYVLPIVIFAKEGKFRDGAIVFTSLFMLIGGLIVMIYPNDVFGGDYEYTIIQTMIHHGSQVIIGIYSICYTRNKIKLFSFLKALPLFAVLCVLAVVLNEIIYATYPGYVNLWSISRQYGCNLPILGDIYSAVPYWLFLIVYFAGFAFLAFLINSISLGIIKLTKIKNEK